MERKRHIASEDGQEDIVKDKSKHKQHTSKEKYKRSPKLKSYVKAVNNDKYDKQEYSNEKSISKQDGKGEKNEKSLKEKNSLTRHSDSDDDDHEKNISKRKSEYHERNQYHERNIRDKRKGKYDSRDERTVMDYDEKRYNKGRESRKSKYEDQSSNRRDERTDYNSESKKGKSQRDDDYYSYGKTKQNFQENLDDSVKRNFKYEDAYKNKDRNNSWRDGRADDNTHSRRERTHKDDDDYSDDGHSKTKQSLQEQLDGSVKRKRETYGRPSGPDFQKQANEIRSERNQRSPDHEPDKDDKPQSDTVEPLSKRQKISNINMRTGGAYIPPARLRMMQEQIKDKGSEQYQRIAWEALKKSIVGMTNKVNASNIAEIVPELFKENIIRGRGILSRAVMQAQAASPTFTRVYAALVAIINTKFPEIGELILKRLILQYKRAFRRNDKTLCSTAARFIAHLLNQEVAHEIIILEMVTHLLENPTDDSVEIAISTLKECGKKLTQLTPRGMRAITQRVRDVLHEGNVDVRVRYIIEVFFAIQKDGFKDFETIPEELDLVQEDDKYTHLINLDDAVDNQEMLNIFKFDPNYEENEEKYKSVVKEILGDSSDEEHSGDESDSEGEEDEENKGDESQQIIDMTETNIVCLRRKIYLTVQSSLDFEECAHKLLKLELKPGQILEMCYMILDCCAQQRTYEKFFGLLAQRFCQLNKIYVEPFTEIFENSYKTIHRLETNKLRNVAKFFAHLLYTDAIPWMVLSIIKLNEDDTTSSSRIFIKILFQELCEYMGLPKLNDRVKDVTLQEAFDGLFPRDHPHNTRFAINFFTSIGLGGLTDELREHLKNLPKTPIVPQPTVVKSSSSSSESSSESSSDSSSSSSSSESEDSTPPKKSKKKVQKRKK